MRPLFCLFLLFTTLTGTGLASAAEAPLRVHFPDGGLPPFLFLPPGGQKPAGIIVDLIEATARTAGRTVRYEFLPREQANDVLAGNRADVALFFKVTRPPNAQLLLSTEVMPANALLVSTKDKPLAFHRSSDLRDQPLCVLTDDNQPQLALLAMNGHLIQRRTKTEQAELMMLHNGDCVASVMSAPVFAWLRTRYGGEDLVAAETPLVADSALLGFRPAEQDFAGRLDRQLAAWRASGELDRTVTRYLPKK